MWKNAQAPKKDAKAKADEAVDDEAGEFGSLPYIIQSLIQPTKRARTTWGSTMFAAVALAGPDIQPQPKDKQHLPQNSEIEYDLKCLEFFLAKSSFNTSKLKSSTGKSDPGSKGVEKIDTPTTKVDLQPLANFVESIHDILVNYAMIQAHCKAEQTLARTSGKTKAAVKKTSVQQQLKKFKEEHHLQRMCYYAITAFAVSGVRGLFFLPNNYRTITVNGCLQLLTLSAKIADLEQIVVKEPVWKRTNRYICSILQSIFNPDRKKDFTEVHVSRYEVAVALALDFGDFWAGNNRSEQERYLVELPRTVKMDTRFERVEEHKQDVQ